MSRVGKKIINISENVEVNITDDVIKVIGPKGELELRFPPGVFVKQADKQMTVGIKNPQLKKNRALWGTCRSLIANLIEGVTKGFSKQLEISGIGFKAQVKDKKLLLNLGFSHQIEFPIPSGIEIKIENNIITITGADKQLVGEVAAQIRSLKKPEPYKGKGIKYLNEVIRRKAGKVVKTGEG